MLLQLYVRINTPRSPHGLLIWSDGVSNNVTALLLEGLSSSLWARMPGHAPCCRFFQLCTNAVSDKRYLTLEVKSAFQGVFQTLTSGGDWATISVMDW